uniref:MAT 1.2.1 n=1 Tax=Fusarium tucumaniae TaxID=232081 RepID=A0A075MEG5_9HYPO|nr:MAT 1.2.1 [Fusarium tucumaniae]
MSSNDVTAATQMATPLQVVTEVDMGELTILWEHLKAQLPGESTKILTIAGEHYRALDQGAKAYLACKLMGKIHEPVLYARDGNGSDVVYLGTPRALTTGVGMLANAAGATEAVWMARDAEPAPAKIPRPPNAYILYRKERHHIVKDLHPGITNNEISQILGRCWNMESREIRAEYKSRADEAKRLHYEKPPAYQYRPRRPSEKRRRNAGTGNAGTGNASTGNTGTTSNP